MSDVWRCPVKRTNSPLSPACFTFVREPIYHEPGEVVRMAGVPNIMGRRHAKALSAPGVVTAQSSASASSSASDCRDSKTTSEAASPDGQLVQTTSHSVVSRQKTSFIFQPRRLGNCLRSLLFYLFVCRHN